MEGDKSWRDDRSCAPWLVHEESAVAEQDGSREEEHNTRKFGLVQQNFEPAIGGLSNCWVELGAEYNLKCIKMNIKCLQILGPS